MGPPPLHLSTGTEVQGHAGRRHARWAIRLQAAAAAPVFGEEHTPQTMRLWGGAGGSQAKSQGLSYHRLGLRRPAGCVSPTATQAGAALLESSRRQLGGEVLWLFPHAWAALAVPSSRASDPGHSPRQPWPGADQP